MEQAGYFKPLEAMTGRYNEITMFMSNPAKSGFKSKTELRLQCKKSINFSGIFLLNVEAGKTLIGYGEPPQTKELKGGKQNPFFDNRADGYLFLIAPDMNTIEILIVPQGRQLIRGWAAKLADGQLNDALNELRK